MQMSVMVAPLADKKYKKIGTRLLKAHRMKLHSKGYGIWENVIEETWVRASIIRYLIDHGYRDEEIRQGMLAYRRIFRFQLFLNFFNSRQTSSEVFRQGLS